MLNGREISSRGLVQNDREERYRASSYDVSVGEIIDPEGNTHKSFKLVPQDMVIVVSEERLKLPTVISGYSMPKTALGNEGLLALSTGIIDPGYEGNVSTMLINFGSTPYFLQEGDAFLRITFHFLALVGQRPETPPPVTKEEYLRARKKTAVALPDTFLDIPGNVAIIADKVAERQLSRLVAIFGALGLLLLVVAFLGAPFVGRILPDRGDISEEVLSELREEDVSRLDRRILDLEQRLDELEMGEIPLPIADQ